MNYKVVFTIFVLLLITACGGSGGTSSSSTPTGLTVTQVTSNSASISWAPASDNSGYYSLYKIYRNGVQIGSTSGTTVFTDTNLQPAISYTYSVAGTSTQGVDSEKSTPITATTLALSLLINKLDECLVADSSGNILIWYLSPKLVLIAHYIDPSTLQDLPADKEISLYVINMNDGSVLRHVTTTVMNLFSNLNVGEGAYLSGEIL